MTSEGTQEGKKASKTIGKTVSVRLSDEEYESLKNLLQYIPYPGVQVSDLLRDAIRQYVVSEGERLKKAAERERKRREG